MTILVVPDDYATVTLALAAASPEDEIQIKSGTYPESILVSAMDHITLVGVNAGGGLPIISPASNTHPGYDCSALILDRSSFITVSNIVLKNLVADPGETNYGVTIIGSADIVVQNTEMTELKSGAVLKPAAGPVTCQRLVFSGCNLHDITFTGLSEGIGIDDQGATQNDVTVMNCTFKDMQYGIGFNPLDAVGVVGKYVVTDNVFDTIDQIGLAVECNEGAGTNTATILAYRNNFVDNLVANMHYSETTVHSMLSTPSPQIYCWKNIPRLGMLGNYYSTHVGVDANDDGIFDNLEVISANHVDAAPLFHQWGPDYTSCQRIRGYVYDASAADSDNTPVPMVGVTVTATDLGTGVSQSAVTNGSGYYYFSTPPVGESVLIQVNVSGFVISEVKKSVDLSSNLPIDFYLWNVHRYKM